MKFEDSLHLTKAKSRSQNVHEPDSSLGSLESVMRDLKLSPDQEAK